MPPDDDFELDTAAQITIKQPPVAETGEPNFTVDTDGVATESTTTNETSGQISVSQETTRSKIAWTFTQIFLLLIITALILPTFINIGFPGIFPDPLESTKSFVTLIASVLAGPFGFIVGFYFKQERE